MRQMERILVMNHDIVKIENLVKRFDDNTVLDGIKLTVHEGEVLVIVGPSGCGKSTLLRCINGLESIQGGSITFRGEAVDGRSADIAKIRQKIGMVFQSYELFPHMSILENVVISPVLVQKRDRREVEKEALQLLERVGLEDKKDSYPRQLSGGQKQRVAIVRALCMHPEVLLFDEVTAGARRAGADHGHRHARDVVCKGRCGPGDLHRRGQYRGGGQPGRILRAPADGAGAALPQYLHFRKSSWCQAPLIFYKLSGKKFIEILWCLAP